MRISKFSKGLIKLAIFGVGFTSCVSTTTVEEPKMADSEYEEISINFSVAKDINTRADADHKLRYVAKLFRTSLISASNFVQRKDLIEGTEGNTIKFKVDPGIYRVIIFADYIPSDFEADENGIYPDYYYDTSSLNESIVMLAFNDHKDKANPINNDNYDCFSIYSSAIEKVEDKATVIDKLELTRAVAKVRFISNSIPEAENFSLTLSKFSYYDTFYQTDGTFLKSDFDDSLLRSLNFTKPSNLQNNELFFFYTLASGTTKQLQEISFKVVTDGETVETNVPRATIPVKRNYTTTLKGKFAYEEEIEIDNPEDYIILENMSAGQTWDTPDLTADF
ncbi:MAG: hypothetical protein J1E95_03810 [Muribaculaceae bacterium]|nr:hypothetical protein [Muribaculaceae bacterium]